MSTAGNEETVVPIHVGSIPTKVRLTQKQLQALRACSKGISLRFEEWEIVNALVECGFAAMNAAGVIRVTEEGHRYLRSHRG